MAGEEAFWLSMDDEIREKGSQLSDEMWSELSKPSGREFDLPSLADHISATERDGNVDLAFSAFQMFDVPIDTFLQSSGDPSFAANLTDSIQILDKMAPSVHNALSVDDQNETNPINSNFSFDGRLYASETLQPVLNQSKDVLVAQNTPFSGSNGFTINNHAYLSSSNNPAYSMAIPITASTAMNTEPAFTLGESGQPFGFSQVQVGTLKYAGSDGERKLTGFGGPLGFHEIPVPTHLDLADPSERKANENCFSNKGKEKLPFHSDTVQQEWGQTCKRFKAGDFRLDNDSSENKARPFSGSNVELSSSRSVLMEALEALKEIPYQGSVRQRHSVFKEPSSSKNPKSNRRG